MVPGRLYRVLVNKAIWVYSPLDSTNKITKFDVKVEDVLMLINPNKEIPFTEEAETAVFLFRGMVVEIDYRPDDSYPFQEVSLC